MNHYRTLKLSPEASREDIREAFTTLIREHRERPRETNQERIAKAREINIAFLTLSDPAKRRAYDESIGIAPPAREAVPTARRSSAQAAPTPAASVDGQSAPAAHPMEAAPTEAGQATAEAPPREEPVPERRKVGARKMQGAGAAKMVAAASAGAVAGTALRAEPAGEADPGSDLAAHDVRPRKADEAPLYRFGEAEPPSPHVEEPEEPGMRAGTARNDREPLASGEPNATGLAAAAAPAAALAATAATAKSLPSDAGSSVGAIASSEAAPSSAEGSQGVAAPPGPTGPTQELGDGPRSLDPEIGGLAYAPPAPESHTLADAEAPVIADAPAGDRPPQGLSEPAEPTQQSGGWHDHGSAAYEDEGPRAGNRRWLVAAAATVALAGITSVLLLTPDERAEDRSPAVTERTGTPSEQVAGAVSQPAEEEAEAPTLAETALAEIAEVFDPEPSPDPPPEQDVTLPTERAAAAEREPSAAATPTEIAQAPPRPEPAREAREAPAEEPAVQPPPPVQVALPAPQRSRAGPARWAGGGLVNTDNPRGQYEGTVGVRFTVQPSGRVSDCTPVRSSGNGVLDTLTCQLVERRVRFTPATNAEGNAIASQVTNSYTWGRRRRQ